MVLIVTLIVVGMGFADEATGIDATGAEGWIGAWADTNHSLSIKQSGQEFIGIGTPNNPEIDYPFWFSGILSEDGTVLQTVMKETGTREFRISDDLMSFSGTGTIDLAYANATPFTFDIHGARNGTALIPENIWTGEWLTGDNTSVTFNQDGNSITGSAHPVSDPEYIEEFKATVSDEGKTVFITWSMSQDVDFTLSDDGMYLIETECGEDEIAKGEVCFNLTKQV